MSRKRETERDRVIKTRIVVLHFRFATGPHFFSSSKFRFARRTTTAALDGIFKLGQKANVLELFERTTLGKLLTDRFERTLVGFPRPDITIMVGWALKINYLSIYGFSPST